MDTWTISELAAHAASVLADLEVNGRVQDVPNERLIRWYTTLGLLDPPLRQGRTVRYDGRHLLQLVAVKRRQASGLTLAEIQAELTGAPTEALLAITGPLPGVERPTSAPSGRAEPAAPAQGVPPRRFWAAPSSPSAPAEPAVDVQWAPRSVVEQAASAESVPMQGVRLAPGVTLLLETAALSPEDLAALRAAAAPLLGELAERGLLSAPADASPGREGAPEHLQHDLRR